MTGRKNTPEAGLGLLQAGKHLLEIIKFRSSGDTNVSAGQSTWKINTAGHYGKGCYMCVFAKKVELAALQACGLQMSPLLREIYWSFLLLEMRKLLVATSVLCTFTAEEQPPALGLSCTPRAFCTQCCQRLCVGMAHFWHPALKE